MYDFAYHKPSSLAEAVKLLADPDAKALSGGQTLLPALKHRLNRPSALVDLTGIAEMKGIRRDGDRLTVQAGEDWDGLVARTVAEELAGMEALSGIPGSTGATPVQNVGAYGQEVAQTITAVRVYDRAEKSEQLLTPAECGFAYRDSRLKREPGRFVVLEVEFQLDTSGLSAPLRFGPLAKSLGAKAADERFPAPTVREHVLRLRAGKGMVLDDQDRDTWSAGSFFTNPIVSPEAADTAREAARTTETR